MIDRLIVLPLYPQYSATTGGSTFDAVSDVLKRWRWVPSLHMVMNFADHPGYIAAVAESIREAWRERGKPRRLLYSFHGIPKQYLLDGDPYHCLCHKTARLVSESLGLQREEYDVCFQSLFGKDEWLRPYTSERLEELGKEKLESIHVVCPGFSADCLETIEEIGEENREVFQHAGGGEYHYIPALNGRPDFCDSLVQLVLDSCPQWFARQEAPTAGAECQARYEVEAKRVEAYTPKGK
jgi:ferrochelatase